MPVPAEPKPLTALAPIPPTCASCVSSTLRPAFPCPCHLTLCVASILHLLVSACHLSLMVTGSSGHSNLLPGLATILFHTSRPWRMLSLCLEHAPFSLPECPSLPFTSLSPTPPSQTPKICQRGSGASGVPSLCTHFPCEALPAACGNPVCFH